MSKPIHETERCKLFERIASEIWDRIIKAHGVGQDLQEPGLTSDIVVEILHYNKIAPRNFGVYAQHGWLEKIYGSDIDVFVETNTNEYRWFALQAKLLKQDNTYDTLRDTSNSIMQWLKLTRLERTTNGGCKPYYLLYNGSESYRVNKLDRCDRQFTEEQFGCSLVPLQVIQHFATLRGPGKRRKWIVINPTFQDIHPAYAQPWRILTCCYLPTYGHTLYSIEDIEKANRNYVDLSTMGFEGVESLIAQQGDGSTGSDDPITTASQKAGWYPALRFVVHRTDNLD